MVDPLGGLQRPLDQMSVNDHVPDIEWIDVSRPVPCPYG